MISGPCLAMFGIHYSGSQVMVSRLSMVPLSGKLRSEELSLTFFKNYINDQIGQKIHPKSLEVGYKFNF